MDSDARREIEALIPHRPPFLFVDRIVDRTEDSITTEWCPPKDFPAFAGHYPGTPVLPGVLISEFCFQSAALLLADPENQDGIIPVLTKIESARFRRIVKPGETLRATVHKKHALGQARYMTGRIECDGSAVLRIEFVVAEVPAEEHS